MAVLALSTRSGGDHASAGLGKAGLIRPVQAVRRLKKNARRAAETSGAGGLTFRHPTTLNASVIEALEPKSVRFSVDSRNAGGRSEQLPFSASKRLMQRSKRIKSFCAAKPAQKLGWPTRPGCVLAGTAYGSFTPSGLRIAQ